MNNCPNCNSNWIGGEIPDDLKHHYSPPYVWKREIGIDGGYLGIYDGIVALKCPDCGEYSPVSPSKFHLHIFWKFLDFLKEVNDETK
jgi:hypothetical protein